MHDFEIVTDSTCDLPPETISELGVTMVPLSVTFGTTTYLDQVDITPERFYDLMESTPELPHSSQPSPEAFSDAYHDLVDAGARRILVLTINQELSGTVNSARLGADGVDADVVVYDTHVAAMSHGMMVREAAAMRDAGETIEAVVAHLDIYRAHIQSLFVPQTLENLIKNGRCTRAAGFASSLLDIKVQLALDENGAIVPVHKAKGMHRAFSYIVKAIQEADGADAHVVATFHQVRNRPGCERLLEQMRKAGLTVDVLATTDLGPVIATHTGIGLVAVGAIPIEYTYGAR